MSFLQVGLEVTDRQMVALAGMFSLFQVPQLVPLRTGQSFSAVQREML